jgi:predicted ATP-binding protein involved in virulence
LTNTLKQFYPQVTELSSTSLRSGWKDLRIVEEYDKDLPTPVRVESGSRQINDGLLRILAVLSEIASTKLQNGSTDTISTANSCVLFDEIENGINPELIQRLVEFLMQAKRQVIVTTHSPLILNYLPDNVAREAVLMLFRNGSGYTRSVRLFDLASTQEKLLFLGPGEVYVDSNLERITEEALNYLQSGEA